MALRIWSDADNFQHNYGKRKKKQKDFYGIQKIRKDKLKGERH